MLYTSPALAIETLILVKTPPAISPAAPATFCPASDNLPVSLINLPKPLAPCVYSLITAPSPTVVPTIPRLAAFSATFLTASSPSSFAIPLLTSKAPFSTAVSPSSLAKYLVRPLFKPCLVNWVTAEPAPIVPKISKSCGVN